MVVVRGSDDDGDEVMMFSHFSSSVLFGVCYHVRCALRVFGIGFLEDEHRPYLGMLTDSQLSFFSLAIR